MKRRCIVISLHAINHPICDCKMFTGAGISRGGSMFNLNNVVNKGTLLA